MEEDISDKVKNAKKVNIPFSITRSNPVTSDLIVRINSMKKKYSIVGNCGGYLFKQDGEMVRAAEVLAKMVAFSEENGYTVQDMVEEI